MRGILLGASTAVIVIVSILIAANSCGQAAPPVKTPIQVPAVSPAAIQAKSAAGGDVLLDMTNAKPGKYVLTVNADGTVNVGSFAQVISLGGPNPPPTPLPPPPPPVAPPITGTLHAAPVGSYIVIYGELATADGSKYIVAPDGAGNYHVIPKVIL